MLRRLTLMQDMDADSNMEKPGAIYDTVQLIIVGAGARGGQM